MGIPTICENPTWHTYHHHGPLLSPSLRGWLDGTRIPPPPIPRSHDSYGPRPKEGPPSSMSDAFGSFCGRPSLIEVTRPIIMEMTWGGPGPEKSGWEESGGDQFGARGARGWPGPVTNDGSVHMGLISLAAGGPQAGPNLPSHHARFLCPPCPSLIRFLGTAFWSVGVGIGREGESRRLWNGIPPAM